VASDVDSCGLVFVFVFVFFVLVLEECCSGMRRARWKGEVK
jgi:hypothetical protein